jgi:serine/threonine protein kinase
VSDPLLHIDQIVAERYVVEGILGVGGLAEVYRVRHTGLGSIHALKVLTIRRRGFDERLRLEGQIQAQLRHPNVVSVTDIVEVDGQPGLLMEFVDGTTLEAVLRERGKLPHEEALALMTPVLGALVSAHAIGVVHRDLKPANILLAQTPLGWVPKVVDFGIGKLLDSPTTEGNPRASDTRAGAAMGTPGYISPEQVRDSSSVDQRTDVFALGVILYEMIAGRLPYANPDGSTDITTTLVREAPPLGSLAPAVPAHVAEAIHIAIRKEPGDRFPALTSFVAALGLSGNPVLVEPTAGRTTWSVPPPQSAATTSSATLDSTASRPAVRPTAPTASGLGARLVLVGLPVALGLVGIALAAVGLSFYLAMWVDGPMDDVPEPAPVASIAPPPEPPAPLPDPAVVPTPAPEVAPVTGTAAPAPAPLGLVPAPVAPVTNVQPPDPVADVELPAPVPPEPEPAPVPVPQVPTPAVIAPAPPPPAPQAPRIEAAGRWVGSANGRPLTLTLTTSGTAAQGEMLFPPNRTVRLSGTIDPASGELRLRSEDGIRVDGRVAGGRLDGSYALGAAKSVPFALSR